VHTRGPWSFELTGSVFFYTDNDEFFNGNKLEQKPLLALQAHIIRSFRRGIWASLSAGAVRAGETTINEEQKNDSKEDFLYALSAGFPVSRTASVKLAYLRGRTGKNLGSDTDNIGIGFIKAF
jgi:hypothetical protein